MQLIDSKLGFYVYVYMSVSVCTSLHYVETVVVVAQ